MQVQVKLPARGDDLIQMESEGEMEGERKSGKWARQRRGVGRKLRRITCEMEVDGKVHAAVIRDLTPQGLFVVTRFDAPPGTPVIIRIRRPGGEIWELQATTARHSDGRRGMISDRGLGLVIEEAPLGFHEFFADLRA